MYTALQRLAAARRKLLFPALSVTVALATLVGGIERMSFLGEHSSTRVTVAPADPASSALQAFARGAGLARPATTTEAGSAVATLDDGRDHPQIASWIARLTGSAKPAFEQTLGRMARYEKMILAKLDARQMPRDLIYLAMIESEFNPTARSRVGAVGMWQFMSATARQFGLTVSRGVDERKNPAQATDAALTYLSQLRGQLGSWYLAAAAYNSGAGTVTRALRRVTGRTSGTDADFFTILPLLPKETRDYVPKLIASARIANDPARYGVQAAD